MGISSAASSLTAETLPPGAALPSRPEEESLQEVADTPPPLEVVTGNIDEVGEEEEEPGAFFGLEASPPESPCRGDVVDGYPSLDGVVGMLPLPVDLSCCPSKEGSGTTETTVVQQDSQETLLEEPPSGAFGLVTGAPVVEVLMQGGGKEEGEDEYMTVVAMEGEDEHEYEHSSESSRLVPPTDTSDPIPIVPRDG